MINYNYIRNRQLELLQKEIDQYLIIKKENKIKELFQINIKYEYQRLLLCCMGRVIVLWCISRQIIIIVVVIINDNDDDDSSRMNDRYSFLFLEYIESNELI